MTLHPHVRRLLAAATTLAALGLPSAAHAGWYAAEPVDGPAEIVEDEVLWRELKDRFGDYFKGGMGAESIKDLLASLDRLGTNLLMVEPGGGFMGREDAVLPTTSEAMLRPSSKNSSNELLGPRVKGDSPEFGIGTGPDGGDVECGQAFSLVDDPLFLQIFDHLRVDPAHRPEP